MSQRKWTRPSDYDRAAFHRWLVEASAVRGLSRTKLADLSGIPRTTLNEALRDERLLTAAVREKLIGTLTNDGQEPVVIDRHDLWLISGIDRYRYSKAPAFLQAVTDSSRSFSERAEIAALQAAWIPAEQLWRAGAREAAQASVWSLWARCTLNAATMAHHRGDIRAARTDCEQVIAAFKKQRAVGRGAMIEALVRHGWGSYRSSELIPSHNTLLASIKALEGWQPGADEEFRLVIHQNVRVCDGPTAKAELQHLAYYNFGRTLIEIGLKSTSDSAMQVFRKQHGGSSALLRDGLHYLDEADHIERTVLQRGKDFNNDWLTSLRRVAPLIRLDQRTAGARYLRSAQELGHPYVTGDARASLEWALYYLFREDDRQARSHLAQARAEFIAPVFYAPGVADVLRWESVILTGEGELAAAVEQAFAAVALHPYGDNVSHFRGTAQDLKSSLPTFREFQQQMARIRDAARAEQGEAFRELPQLRTSLHPDAWRTLEQAAATEFTYVCNLAY